MELENNPNPIDTLDMPMSTESYALPLQQELWRSKFGCFARSYPSYKNLVIILIVLALILLSYGTWDLVKASHNKPDKLANTSDYSGNVQKTVVVLPGQDQILSINAKLKINNPATLSGDLVVSGVSSVKDLNVNGNLVVAKSGAFSGDITANNISSANIRGSFSDVYVRDGSALTNLNAGNLSTGMLNDARLSTNVPFLSVANTFTNSNTFTSKLTVQGTINGQSTVFSNNVAALSFTQNGNVVCDSSGNCAGAGSSMVNIIALFTASAKVLRNCP